MRQAWPLVSIESVCQQTPQRDPRKTPEQLFRYVDVSAVDQKTKSIVSPPMLNGGEAPSRARKEIRGGDVLVSTVRPNLNAVCLVHDDLDGQIASTAFCILRPDPALLNNRFLYYYALTPSFVQHLTERASGASYPAVTDFIVEHAQLPLAPLPEQNRIVKLLDAAEELRRLRAAADRRTADLIPALFYDMFGDPYSNDRTWRVLKLGDVLSVLYRYPTFYGSAYFSEGVPVARIGNILTSHQLDPETSNYVRVPNEFSAKFPRTILETGDLVMAVRGDTTGKLAIVPPELAGINISPNLIRLSPRRDLIEPNHLLWLLLLTGEFVRRRVTDTAKKSVTADNLGQIPIAVPPLSLQQRFAARVTEIRALEAQQAASRRRLDDLFQSMLHRAFRGEL